MTFQGLNKNILTFNIRDRLLLLLSNMETAVNRVVNQNNDQFNEDVKTFREDVITIITGGTVGDRLEALFESFDAVSDTARLKYLLARELFAFGESETEPVDNPQLVGSLAVINLTIQLFNIGNAYNNAVNIDFESDVELDEVRNELDNEYNRIVENRILTDEARDSLNQINSDASGYFSNLKVRQVTTVRTNTRPSTVISYQYYGTSSQSDSIVSLNGINDTGYVSGEIKILSTSIE